GENPRTKWRPSLGRTCATAAEFATNAFWFGIFEKARSPVFSTSLLPSADSATRGALCSPFSGGDAAETMPVRLGPATTEDCFALLSGAAANVFFSVDVF